MDDPKLLYRPHEAQAALGIKRTKFYEIVKAGHLELRRMGGCTVVPAESLRAFVASLPPANDAK
jgi:hypothetical protein